MKYYFVQQHDSTDCAAACLATVSLYYKKETTITKLRDMMGTDLKGTNMLGLLKCSEALGFKAQAVRVDRENFLTRFTLPAIANVVTKEGMTHFVVIFKITKKYVILSDPAKGIVKRTLSDFFKDFMGVLLILVPDEGFVKDRTDGKSVIKRYINLILTNRELFIYGIIASIILTVMGIGSSLFNSIIYDEILPYKDKESLFIVMIVFMGLSISQLVMGLVRQIMMVHLSVKIDIPIMLGYFKHIYSLPMKFFASRKTGDIMTRFSDACTIKDVFTNIALTLFMDTGMALLTGCILYNFNSKLFVIIVLITIANILLVLIFKKPFKSVNEKQMQQGAVLNSAIIEGISSIETIKSNVASDYEMDKLEREYVKSLKIGIRENMLSTVHGTISQLISSFGNLLLTYVAIIEVINNNITLGTMMAFMTIAGYFMDPVGRIVSLQLSLQEADISIKRISEILDYKSEEETVFDNSDDVDFGGDIDFKHVTFRYGNRKPVLNDVSFSIPKGSKVALVGSSGSGKSTIAKLLLKYYDVTDGSILIDGVDINGIDSSILRKKISYVPQNIELFSRTILENIKISDEFATRDEVIKAARLSGADEFIKTLPLKYDTFLEEAGKNLSGGERQRIVLARAMLKKNNIYVFDESTSNLDFATENFIFDMIYNKYKDKSMLIIAHRLSTIRNCDCIIVLDKGRVVQKGTHEELMNCDGVYKTLWNMQQGIVNHDNLDKSYKDVSIYNCDVVTYCN